MTGSGSPPGDATGPGAGAPRPDAGPQLPDAPLFALLRNVRDDVGIAAIERVWLFPPRRLKAGETAVAVLAVYADPRRDDRRRVLAAHYTAPADALPRLALDEFGTAPADRVHRVVEDVVERLEDDVSPQPARAYRIDGDADRWTEMVRELAEKYLTEAARDPRLRR